MKKYRIWESHCGDPSEIFETFLASSDKDAKKEFKRIEELPSSEYSKFWMERVDVEEKTTRISRIP